MGDFVKNDADAKVQNLSDDQRLELHQNRSGPVMQELKTWFDEQFDKKTENFSFGKMQ